MENKPRKPWVAGLMSLIQPGLGQIYNGEVRKALILFFLPMLVLPGIMFSLYSMFSWVHLALIAIISLAYYAFVAFDAVKTAKRLKNQYVAKKYNKSIVYILTYLIAGALSTSMSLAVKSNFIQAFKIPGASMEPTMLIGDHILVDRRLSAREPQRGDLVVFEYPRDKDRPSWERRDFIKRIIGLPGDRVKMVDKVVFIDDKPYIIPQEVHKGTPGLTRREIYNFSEKVINPGHYFVMGDNRDRSHDSRFWGTVPQENIKGTVENIYWSWDKSNSSVRWARIGRQVK